MCVIRHNSLQQDMEKEMKNIDYILNVKLSHNEMKKERMKTLKINNNRSANDLRPISPNEFLNNLPTVSSIRFAEGISTEHDK